MQGAPTHAQKGQAIVLIALMLGVVVGMAALAIDGSRAYALRRDLQAAADAAALAAADNFQRTGSYVSAESAASTSLGVNLRVYGAPSCSPGYGTPGASPYTVTCTYADGTTLIDVASALGPRGAAFQLTAARTLSLQFARILTNGASPMISSPSGARVNNLLYSPVIAALNQAGCGGAGGSAISINGVGTISVIGDVVSSGAISITSGTARVGGDIYARCQASVPGATNQCYPSGANTPCTFPDVAGAIRSGYHYVDPHYPAPAPLGGGVGAPTNIVILQPGIYAGNPAFTGGDCWFLSGGVYDWQAGFTNSADFVSNELKPPDEPNPNNNTLRSAHQFWDSNNVGCAGGLQVVGNDGPNGIAPSGTWGFEVTSTRSDTYNGLSYPRESAPSVCYTVPIPDDDEIVQITVSNVPGATGYNIYASPNACSGPFGFAGTLPVSVPVTNNRPNPCPSFAGNGCSLGHESLTLDGTSLNPPWGPNSLAAPATPGAYPPNSETAPLSASLPNQNPARGAGAAGDRANENNCESTAGAYVTCPDAIIPGAVEFYLPGGACMSTTNFGDTYIFSGYQYNWMAVYQAPGNTCAMQLGGSTGSATIGLVYAPSAPVTVSSSLAYETAATGGIIADTIAFNGSLPSINFSPAYAPAPFAARLVS